MEKPIRYYFVLVAYNTTTGTGKGNLGIQTNELTNDFIRATYSDLNEDVLKESIVVENFFEMTKEDYFAFWGIK